MQSSGLIAAVTTASVAVVVAVVTQIWTSVRARADRSYAARRQAIDEAQDAALELRTSLSEFGTSVRRLALGEGSVDPETDRDLQRARGRFEIALSRVQDEAVADALRSWQQAASGRFLSVLEVDAALEDEWFRYVNTLAGMALRSSAGQTSERARRSLTPPRTPPG